MGYGHRFTALRRSMNLRFCLSLLFLLVLILGGCEADNRHEELRKAVAAKKKGNVTEAIAMYTKLIDEGAFTEDAHNRSILFYNRGLAWSDLKDYPKAVEDYGKAIELRPEFITCYHNRSIVYEKMGELKKALADIQRIIQLEPTDSDAKERLEYLQDKLKNAT